MDTREDIPDWLALGDDALLADCDVRVTRGSGPGGQHRNKVSTAVRLRHRPTGLSSQGEESRSQIENKRSAVRRMRMQIALHVRRRIDRSGDAAALPEALTECLARHRGRGPNAPTGRIEVSQKNPRFWPLAQVLLDALDTCEGRIADAGRLLGVSTSNLIAQFKRDRHLFAAAGDIRKRHGQGAIR